MEPDPSVIRSAVVRVEGECALPAREDSLAVEEPLEIRLGYDSKGWRVHKSVSITMRTPGADRELAAGFLFTEGIVLDAEQIAEVCIEKTNVVRVELQPGQEVDLRRLERHFYTSSSCGVCGKTSISALSFAGRAHPLADSPIFAAATIHRLPQILRETQSVFDQTGGLHAAALFDAAGKLHIVREDVGRHNAVDKLIGAQLLAGTRPPFDDRLLFVSGRASFELMQKALAAGIPMLAAVGAPSSLAVDLARAHGATLLGFVRGGRFNIYCGAARIREMRDFGASDPPSRGEVSTTAQSPAAAPPSCAC